MSGKLSQPSRRTTQKSYASRVLQESSVGMVSSLAETTSKPRRWFKVFVLIFCLTGFLYQSGEFLGVVFQYPTTVNVEVIRPDVYNMPAYTFCDNNGIKRSLFCEMYPNQCEEADEAVCDNYEAFCGENNTLVPIDVLVLYMPLEEILQLNGNLSDFLWMKSFRDNHGENVTGPHWRTKQKSEQLMVCYSLNDRMNSPLDGLQTKKQLLTGYPITGLTFHLKEEDVLLPGTEPGLLFSIHSPFGSVNPFEDGIFMKPGKTYMIYVSMEEEILLPSPYNTDCMNYTQQWETNGRSGPRTQQMCLHACLIEFSIGCYNCVFPILFYPSRESICSREKMRAIRCPKNDIEKVKQCHLNCKEDCHRTKYTYKVQERSTAAISTDYLSREKDYPKNYVTVEVYMDISEIVVLKHSPKYMVVEVFSTIGGFIGGWLGISLLDVSDILEGFCRITLYSFKRKGRNFDTAIRSL